MSIDYCMKCDKRLDTDFVEYQDDGALLCDACLDEREAEQDRGIVLTSPLGITEAEREALQDAVGVLRIEGFDAESKIIESLLSRSREVARAGAEQEKVS